jgi:hypothetical protein
MVALGIMTLSIMTLSKMKLCKMTLSKMTLSILSIMTPMARQGVVMMNVIYTWCKPFIISFVYLILMTP